MSLEREVVFSLEEKKTYNMGNGRRVAGGGSMAHHLKPEVTTSKPNGETATGSTGVQSLIGLHRLVCSFRFKII